MDVSERRRDAFVERKSVAFSLPCGLAFAELGPCTQMPRVGHIDDSFSWLRKVIIASFSVARRKDEQLAHVQLRSSLDFVQ
jgi:hypothetical protein